MCQKMMGLDHKILSGFLKYELLGFFSFFAVFISTQIPSDNVPLSLHVQKCISTAADFVNTIISWYEDICKAIIDRRPFSY